MADGRRDLHARITIKSHDAWTDFCDEHGITITALIEAMGERFGHIKRLSPPGIELLERAKAIDRERKRRRRQR